MSDKPNEINRDEINIKELIKSLEPDVLGKFEPMSGLMLFNLSDAEFDAAKVRIASHSASVEDRTLLRTMCHEMYHGIQVGASGYGFDRQRRLFAVFNTVEKIPDPIENSKFKGLIAAARAEADEHSELKDRVDRTEAAARMYLANQILEARAAPGDNSLFGAIHPDFIRCQTEVTQREAVCNADGLSIQGLLEGSAVAFTYQLLQPNGVQDAIEAQLVELPPVYRELYDMTTVRVGARALELLLPAAALALCYSEPHYAYGAMLSILAASPPGYAGAYGRTIMANLPTIQRAGTILGIAVHLRRSDDSYRVYDKFIQELGTKRDGVDAYTMLCEPDVMNRLGFPFPLVTTDGIQQEQNKWSLSGDDLAARLVIMAAVLRVRSRRREELQMQKFVTEWGRDTIERLFTSAQDAKEQGGTT
jgi:hypothetical protein